MVWASLYFPKAYSIKKRYTKMLLGFFHGVRYNKTSSTGFVIFSFFDGAAEDGLCLFFLFLLLLLYCAYSAVVGLVTSNNNGTDDDDDDDDDTG